MAVFNPAKKEINVKVVYYGPSLGGKTTSVQYIHKKLDPKQRGEMVSLATKDDRTLFFDFLPVELGNVRGYKTRFHIYTVPGQVTYNLTRRAVLTGVDTVIFVADSQEEKMNENIESFRNLEENLKYYHKDIKDIPMVLQYNKRDLPNISSVEKLNRNLNHLSLPFFLATAAQGGGVIEALTMSCKMTLRHLERGAGGKRPLPEPGRTPVAGKVEAGKVPETKIIPERRVETGVEKATIKIDEPILGKLSEESVLLDSLALEEKPPILEEAVEEKLSDLKIDLEGIEEEGEMPDLKIDLGEEGEQEEMVIEKSPELDTVSEKESKVETGVEEATIKIDESLVGKLSEESVLLDSLEEEPSILEEAVEEELPDLKIDLEGIEEKKELPDLKIDLEGIEEKKETVIEKSPEIISAEQEMTAGDLTEAPSPDLSEKAGKSLEIVACGQPKTIPPGTIKLPLILKSQELGQECMVTLNLSFDDFKLKKKSP